MRTNQAFLFSLNDICTQHPKRNDQRCRRYFLNMSQVTVQRWPRHDIYDSWGCTTCISQMTAYI